MALVAGDACGQLPCCSAQAAAREVHVLAAADLQPVMPALARAYEHATGMKLVVSFGSSSTLATQIINGEPADLFLAADFSFPEKVVAAGLADCEDAGCSMRAGRWCCGRGRIRRCSR